MALNGFEIKMTLFLSHLKWIPKLYILQGRCDRVSLPSEQKKKGYSLTAFFVA